MTRACALVAMVLLAVGCGDSTTTTPADLAMSLPGSDIAVYSVCGHPGDTGNSKNVGHYCMEQGMCPAGTICSTIMPIPQGPTYFCTVPCDINAADPNAPCGENATCTCLSALACGCVPNECRIGLFG